jgi:hypothetical protein
VGGGPLFYSFLRKFGGFNAFMLVLLFFLMHSLHCKVEILQFKLKFLLHDRRYVQKEELMRKLKFKFSTFKQLSSWTQVK